MLNAVVDLSHWQASVDFALVAADGIVGVLHKATQGTTWTDPLYPGRKPQALAAKLLWGTYHFGTNDDGQAQAQHFLDTVQPAPTDLLVLDFEPGGSPASSMTADQAVAFVQYVYARTGRYPGLYATNDHLQQTGAATRVGLAPCWLWIADYDPVASPAYPPLWNIWTMWQYTPNGSVAGIQGACDRNRFNGPLPNLYRLWNAPLPAGSEPA